MKHANKISTLFITLVILLPTVFSLQAYKVENDTKLLSLIPAKDANFYLSPIFFDYLTSLFNVTILVETGTYDGGTINNALNFFKEIHSIELSKNHYKNAMDRFKYNQNVHLHCGDSSEVISKILPKIQGKILFWLDGHYSEGNTAKGKTNTPIMGELAAIKKQGINDAVILIDDMRCFRSYDNNQQVSTALLGYPTVTDLYNALKQINSDYMFVIYGDIGLAFLPNKSITVSPVIKACTTCRFNMDTKINNDELQQAQHIIAHAVDQEKEALVHLYKTFSTNDPNNLGQLYKQWYISVNTNKK